MEFGFRISSSSSSDAAQSKLEMRTIFTLIRWLEEGDEDSHDCEMWESECLSLSLSSSDSNSDRDLLLQQFRRLNCRLKEYKMPADQIQALLRETLHRIASDDGVIVDVSVCTKQKEGETMDETLGRTVEPESLTPLEDLLLPRDDEGEEGFENLTDACPICLVGPASGAPVSRLPCCGQAFHTHCVLQWFLLVPSCPLCRNSTTGHWAAEKFQSPTSLGPQDLPAQRKRPIEDMPAHPPAKRNRQPSSWLRDYYVT